MNYETTEAQYIQIDKAFTYHPPLESLKQNDRYRYIRDNGRSLALELTKRCPPSRELALALTKLEEAVMWANAAIARNE